AIKQGLPSLHGIKEFVAAGGLMSYGASLADLARRAANYVDRILRGAKPADLPVQQPTKRVTGVGSHTASRSALCRQTPKVGEAMGRAAEDMAPSSSTRTDGGCPVAQVNDLSRSLTAFDPISTLVVVVEMSKARWLVSGAVPGVERQPLKKLEP